jgi:hypothetical protein
VLEMTLELAWAVEGCFHAQRQHSSIGRPCNSASPASV